MDKDRKDPTKSGFMGAIDLGGGALAPGNKKFARKEGVTTSIKKDTVTAAKPKDSAKSDLAQLRTIDTKLIQPWQFSNRPANEFGDMDDLTQSIEKNGQQVPVLVRPQGKEFSLIYGRRRYQVAKELGIPLLCQVKKIDDKEAFVAQASENEQRKNLSSWAKSLDYRKALDQGVFKSTAALAASLGLERSSVSNILVYTTIPKEIIEAIEDMRLVGIQTAKTIARLCREDAKHLEVIVANAVGLRDGKIGSIRLDRICNDVKTRPRASKVIRGEAGDLFSMATTSRGALTITILKNAKRTLTEDEIVEVLRNAFDEKSKTV